LSPRHVVIVALVILVVALGATTRLGREWRALVATAARVLTGEGSVVVVLGDSNSCGWNEGCAHDAYYWPDRRVLPGGWRMENASLPGMGASEHYVCANDNRHRCSTHAECGGDATCIAGTLGDGLSGSGAWRLDHIIAKYAPERRHACVLAWLGAAPQLVLALGTNDVVRYSGAIVGQRVLTLYDHARAALPCFQIYLAMLPPRGQDEPGTIQQANATIRSGMEARGAVSRIVPFDQQTTDDLGPDGVHMAAAGQEHRAQLAFAALGW
jgi:hypothetical protein